MTNTNLRERLLGLSKKQTRLASCRRVRIRRGLATTLHALEPLEQRCLLAVDAIYSLTEPTFDGATASFEIDVDFQADNGETLRYFGLDFENSEVSLTSNNLDYSAFTFELNAASFAGWQQIGVLNDPGFESSVEFHDLLSAPLPSGQYRLGTLYVDFAAAGAQFGDVLTVSIESLESVIGYEDSDPATTFLFEEVSFDPGTQTLVLTDLSGAAEVDEGAEYTLSFNGVSTACDYIIQWGDGSTETVSGSVLTSNPDVVHAYADGDSSPTIRVFVEVDGVSVTAGQVGVTVNDIAPTVSLSGDETTLEGSSYTLTLGEFVDPGEDTVSQLVIDWGDGEIETFNAIDIPASREIEHVFADGPANPTISVDLVDEEGIHQGVTTLSVNVENLGPTVELIGDASVEEGAAYTLTVGPVNDVGNDVVISYEIDWGDGTIETFLVADFPTDRTLAHTYVDGPLNSTIAVSITDSDGTFETAGALAVSVENVSPTVAVAGDAVVDEGSTFTLVIGDVIDPGNDEVSQYVISWGDGTTQTIEAAELLASGEVTHIYADGDFASDIGVTLVDEDGTHNGAGEFEVLVSNVEPSIVVSGDPTADEGSVFSLAIESIVDPGADTATSVKIDWGDGEFETIAIMDLPVDGIVTHTYADDLPATITLEVTDEDGTFVSGGTSVVVDNVLPTVEVSGDPTATIGTEYAVILGPVTDPGNDTATNFIIDWGDGDIETVPVLDPAIPFQVSHVFPAGSPSDTTISIRIVDEDGIHAAAGSLSIVVESADQIEILGKLRFDQDLLVNGDFEEGDLVDGVRFYSDRLVPGWNFVTPSIYEEAIVYNDHYYLLTEASNLSPFTVEAETIIASGFTELNESISGTNNSFASLSGSVSAGSLSYTYQGEAGDYQLRVAAFDENDGQGSIEVFVNGESVASHLLDRHLGNNYIGVNNLVSLDAAVSLVNGDLIEVTATTDGGEFMRIDRLSFDPAELTWKQAEAEARKLTGHLVAINDAEEQAFLVNVFGDWVTRAWIGLTDEADEGDFVWTSGDPVNYAKWGPHEPNDSPNLGGEDYGELILDRPGGEWNDLPNAYVLQRGIIEVDAGVEVPLGETTYLSDLTPIHAENGWGPFEIDQSNGETEAGDGNRLTLNGVEYAKGLGVHSVSELIYELDAAYGRFQADIGIDDEVGSNGSVRFKVFGDGELLYNSPVMTGDSDTISLDMDINGVDELTLRVTRANGSKSFDHANWADAKLIAHDPGVFLHGTFDNHRPAIELWHNTATPASSGATFWELDSSRRALDGIYQDVDTTSGQVLTLSFDMLDRIRPNEATPLSNSVEVFWEGSSVGTFAANRADEWQTISVDLVALSTTGVSRLEFREIAESLSGEGFQGGDSYGPFIDNLRLTTIGDECEFFISENAPIGTAIGGVLAEHSDGEALSYSITSGNDAGLFRIDPNSGIVSVANGLDFESEPNYHELSIEVTDGAQTVTVVFNVTELDGNDAPEFVGATQDTDLIQNGSFEEGDIDEGWDYYASEEVPGWTAGGDVVTGSADLLLAVDDEFELFLNGTLIGSGTQWNESHVFEGLTITEGDVVAIHGVDTGGPGGAIGELRFSNSTLYTNDEWKVSRELAEGWNTQGFDDSDWSNAREHGTYGVTPWQTNIAGIPSDTEAEWIWSNNIFNHNEVFLRFTVPDTTSEPAIEVWNDYIVDASNGTNLVELDSRSIQLDRIWQDVPTGGVNRPLTLKFDIRQRPDTDPGTNTIEAWWDDELVGTYEPSETWETITIAVPAPSTSQPVTRLEFRESVEDNDSFGGLIDHVRLTIVTDEFGFTVSEDVAINALIGTVLAVDPNGDEVSFSIVAGNEEGRFAIDSQSGAIRVANVLDYETQSLYLLTIAASDGELSTLQDVTIDITDVVEPTPKFFVPDSQRRETFRYELDGSQFGDATPLAELNNHPAGATSSTTGKLWVVDNAKWVFIYDADGTELGVWRATDTNSPRGIAVDNADLWIVDSGNRQVRRYDGGAEFTEDEHVADFVFSLHNHNDHPSGIASDGTKIWVTDWRDDQVYIYNAATGEFQSRWDLDSDNGSPAGITNDPSGELDHVWVVDSWDEKVYQYEGGVHFVDGDQEASDSFQLHPANRSPAGIADPRSVRPEGIATRDDLFANLDSANQEIGAIPGDTNADGNVDFRDFLVLARHFGRRVDGRSTDGDFDGDQFVDFLDFLALSRNYETTKASMDLASLSYDPTE